MKRGPGPAAATLILALLCACTQQPRGGWEQYPYLSPRVYPGERYAVDGRALRTGPGVTEVALEAYPSSLAIVTMKLCDEQGRERVTADAIVDTGFQGSLGLSARSARRARVWLWPEARGRQRYWSLDRGLASLGVVASAKIGDSTVSGVPASVHGGETIPAVLGLEQLRCWSRAELDFGEQRLLLKAGAPLGRPSDSIAELAFKWWDPTGPPGGGAAWVEDHGFISAQASVNGIAIEVLIDTGVEADLVVPSSFAALPPWRDVLELDGTTTVHSIEAVREARTAIVRGTFSLDDETLDGLRALIVDDSTMPPGHSLPPLVGMGVLRRYQAVEFDFESRLVRLRK